MKFLVATLALLLSVSASAGPAKKSCNFEDYQAINAALEGYEVREGDELRPALASLLKEEMGPICEAVIDDGIRIGIPGNKYRTYEVSGNDRTFQVKIVTGIEQGNSVYIKELL